MHSSVVVKGILFSDSHLGAVKHTDTPVCFSIPTAYITVNIGLHTEIVSGVYQQNGVTIV